MNARVFDVDDSLPWNLELVRLALELRLRAVRGNVRRHSLNWHGAIVRVAKRPQHPENPTLGRCGLLAEVGKLDVRHLPQNNACQRCPSQRFREDLATAQLQRQVEHPFASQEVPPLRSQARRADHGGWHRRSRFGKAAHTTTSTLGLRQRQIEPLTSLLSPPPHCLQVAILSANHWTSQVNGDGDMTGMLSVVW